MSKNAIRNIVQKSKGVSTIAGKDIWYDPDIQKLHDEGRGLYLGQFDTEDKVLAVFRNGTFYTTSFDLVNKYQGDVLRIEKFDPEKTFTALYYDAAAKAFYVKRFSFVLSDNTPQSFIADGAKSYLVALSDDPHTRYTVTFGGKDSSHAPETILTEDWIAKKGWQAKGKKCHDRYKVKKVEFAEPLHVEEEDEQPEPVEIVTDTDIQLPDTPLPEAKKPETPLAKPSREEPIEIIEEPTLF